VFYTLSELKIHEVLNMMKEWKEEEDDDEDTEEEDW